VSSQVEPVSSDASRDRSWSGRQMGVDQSFSFVGITQRIRDGITSATLTIADISGHNPNLMCEVGLAHGLSRNVLLIRDAATEIPFDVKDIMALTYERVTLYRLQRI
jgi:hypothetical protein